VNRLIAIIFLASLAACGKRPESPRIDPEERKELFIECMKLLPPNISSKDGAVAECDDYAIGLAWDRALTRHIAAQAERERGE